MAALAKINVTGRRWVARSARAVFLAGVAAALTLGSNAAVAQATGVPGLPGQTLAKSCDLGFMPTKPTVTGPSILGNAWAACDVPPERHVFTLSLQYRQGGTWKTAESTTKDAIPNPRQVYEVKTGCEPGLWRVHAKELQWLKLWRPQVEAGLGDQACDQIGSVLHPGKAALDDRRELIDGALGQVGQAPLQQ
jgi:hypothetical protein